MVKKRAQTRSDRAETCLSAIFVAVFCSFESAATDCSNWFGTCFMSVWMRHQNKALVSCG